MIKEQQFKPQSGYTIILLNLIILALALFLFSVSGFEAIALLLLASAFLMLRGYTSLLPNESKILSSFGNYKGVIDKSGFFWVNPFFKKIDVSLKTQSFKSDLLHLNDRIGTPIQLKVSVEWRISQPANAYFQLDNFENFLQTQSESVVRDVVLSYPFDTNSKNSKEISLLRNPQSIQKLLNAELAKKIEKFGIHLIEAKITQLSCASEFTSMLYQSQRTHQIVNSKSVLADAAVKIAERTIQQIENRDFVTLSEDQKVSILNNLIVAICSEHNTHSMNVNSINPISTTLRE